MRAQLVKFPYTYMNYENVILLREIQSSFPTAQISEQDGIIYIDGIDESEINKLALITYISFYIINGQTFYTYQHRFENGNAGVRDQLKKKQITRYSTHGLHEYKGKYNPQIVRAIMNIIRIDSKCSVIDPFCGSGTTMLEALHMGIQAIGTDINPFAVYVSNVKLSSINIDCYEAEEKFLRIKEELLHLDADIMASLDEKRNSYLKRWIPQNELRILEGLLLLTQSLPPVLSNFFRLTASDLIRDYSFQEPSDLRIRRRIAAFPNVPFIEAWESNVKKYIHNISVIQKYRVPTTKENYAIEFDIRDGSALQKIGTYDAAITSPPYATALPYIDTQRISLVWLGMCSPNEIMSLESSLIGSREFYRLQKAGLCSSMLNNSTSLPDVIKRLIDDIYNNISDYDGFRKKAVPLLLYRYFTDMKMMFRNVHALINKNGFYCLVVGHNKSTINNKTYYIDTPQLLSVLAESCEWKVNELISLQTYKRYGINLKNSINHETLIVLQKE